jgi:hypothetical protein
MPSLVPAPNPRTSVQKNAITSNLHFLLRKPSTRARRRIGSWQSDCGAGSAIGKGCRGAERDGFRKRPSLHCVWCGFRRFRTAIPAECGHAFRRKADKHSGRNRTAIVDAALVEVL